MHRQTKSRAYRRLLSGIEYHSRDQEFDGWIKFITATFKRGTLKKDCSKAFHKFQIAFKKQYPYLHYFGVFVYENEKVESHYHLIAFTSGKIDNDLIHDLWLRSTEGVSYIIDVRSPGYFWQKGYSKSRLARYVINQYVLNQDSDQVTFRRSRNWLPKDSEYRWKFLMNLYPMDGNNHFRNVLKYWSAYLKGFAWNEMMQNEFLEYYKEILRKKKVKKEKEIIKNSFNLKLIKSNLLRDDDM